MCRGCLDAAAFADYAGRAGTLTVQGPHTPSTEEPVRTRDELR
jgi:hypothetical protein